MNDMVVFEPQRLATPAELRQQVNLIQQVMQAVMKRETHYGVIPGAQKPSLWKPGAEVLAATFRIAIGYVVEDLSNGDAVRYRVKAIGSHQTTNVQLGEGVGECSTDEEKYKWRKAICDEEFEDAPETRRRVRYGKGKTGTYKVKQIRTEPADLANTVLKIACKRAQIAAILNITAASDIFTQDVEDLPDELRDKTDEPMTAQVVDPASPELLAAAEAAADKGIAAYQDFWQKATGADRRALMPMHAGLKTRATNAGATQ